MDSEGLQQRILAKLSASQHRLTKARIALVEIFSTATQPLSLAELAQSLRQRGVTVHKATLYRELNFFLDQGLIHKVDFKDATPRFEYLAEAHHHHVVCVTCKQVEDIADDRQLVAWEQSVKQKTKFTILSHTLELFGLCKKCQVN
jgi:Fur family ferric uptake transcriptional regulator